VNLRRYFGLAGGAAERDQIIIAETQRGRVGIVVDRVIGDHQTVIKPLGGLCRGTAAFSGATILGDGTIALVLDADRLLAEAARAA
jgi:two-component system chemotaxis sensor kinase CheA